MATLIRPHDSHCFHVDPRATDEVKRAMQALVRCYQKKFPEAIIFLDEVCMGENHPVLLEHESFGFAESNSCLVGSHLHLGG